MERIELWLGLLAGALMVSGFVVGDVLDISRRVGPALLLAGIVILMAGWPIGWFIDRRSRADGDESPAR